VRHVVGTVVFRIRFGLTLIDPIRAREVRPMMRRMKLDRGEAALDLGCYTGVWTNYLRRRVPRAIGIDVDQFVVDWGKRIYPKADLRLADAERLPFPDAEFDRVAFISTLEHIKHPGDALAEVARVLKPGGLVAMSADTLDHPAWRKRRAVHGPRSFIEHFFSREDLIELAREHGLEHVWGNYIYGSRVAELLLRPRLAGTQLHWPLAPFVWLAGLLDADDSGFMYQAVYRRVESQSS
jgi:SAM-dependent methyltransferase